METSSAVKFTHFKSLVTTFPLLSVCVFFHHNVSYWKDIVFDGRLFPVRLLAYKYFHSV